MASPNVLPPNIKSHIFAKSAHAHSALMKESQINWQNSNNLVRVIVGKMLDELDEAESMAVHKVLNLPVVN